MKQLYLSFIIACLFLNFNKIIAQTEWTGPKITFTKANYAVWTLEVNQDRITENVWITRQNQWSIFNIAQGDISEKTLCTEGQPNDTEWAFGTIADGVSTLTFDTFLGPNFTNCGPGGTGEGVSPVGKDAVLHLITDDIYIDIKFLSWTTGQTEVEPGVFGGGGFSYERSTDQNLGINDYDFNNQLKIYPNPSSDFIKIKGVKTETKFKIYNVIMQEVLTGKIDSNNSINIKNLNKGIYFFTTENGVSKKFVKS